MVTAARSDDPFATLVQGLQWVAVLGVCASHFSIGLLPPPHGFISVAASHDVAFACISFLFLSSGYQLHSEWSGRLGYSGAGLARSALAIVTVIALLLPVTWLVLMADLLVAPYPLAAKEATVLRALPAFLTLTQNWTYQTNGETTLHFSFVSSNIAWLAGSLFFLVLVYALFGPLISRLERVKAIVLAVVPFLAGVILLPATLRNGFAGINSFAGDTFGEMARQASADVPSSSSYITWLSIYAPWARLPEFFLGVLLAQMRLRAGGNLDSSACGRAAAILSVLAMLACGASLSGSRKDELAGLAYAIGSAAVMFGTRFFAGRPAGEALARNPAVVFFSGSAFALWMWHLFWYNAYVLPPAIATSWGSTLIATRLVAINLFAILTAAVLARIYQFPIARRVARFAACEGSP